MNTEDKVLVLERQVSLLKEELEAIYSQVETSWRLGRLATIEREYLIADIEELIENSKDESKNEFFKKIKPILLKNKEW